jgi:serine/threonine protein kinase
MEDGGSLDLYKRLKRRDDHRNSLAPQKAQSIMTQVMQAICHLHLGPQVVHRDIKPENIIISENAQEVTVKIADFDLARIDPQVRGTSVVGTFPFIAPEVFLKRDFDQYAIDIWSMAAVFLEVLCSVGVVESALQLQIPHKSAPQQEKLSANRQSMARIHRYFKQPDGLSCLLRGFHHPDLEELMTVSEAFLGGMLNVDATERWTALQVLQVLSEAIQRGNWQ